METVHIYIVNNNISYSYLLQDKLSTICDIETEIFESAEECLRAAYKKPDIIFIDQFLIDKKGLGLLQDLKSKYPVIQVIVVTNEQQLGIAVETLKYGATNYLIKNRQDSIQRLRQVILDCLLASKNIREQKDKESSINNSMFSHYNN